MISGRMLPERNFVSMTFGLLTIGLLHQLLLLHTTTAITEVHTQPPPKPKPETTTKTTTVSTTTKTSTKAPTTTTTTDSMHCWSSFDPKSPEACFRCNICKTGLSGGAIAGIVIGVLLLYIISLILVAILVFVLTKRGTLDLSNWRLFKMMSKREKTQISAELAVPNTYSDETLSPPVEMYTALDRRTQEVNPPEASTYEALQKGGHKNRSKKPRIKKKPKTTVPKATDDEIYQNY